MICLLNLLSSALVYFLKIAFFGCVWCKNIQLLVNTVVKVVLLSQKRPNQRWQVTQQWTNKIYVVYFLLKLLKFIVMFIFWKFHKWIVYLYNLYNPSPPTSPLLSPNPQILDLLKYLYLYIYRDRLFIVRQIDNDR